MGLPCEVITENCRCNQLQLLNAGKVANELKISRKGRRSQLFLLTQSKRMAQGEVNQTLFVHYYPSLS